MSLNYTERFSRREDTGCYDPDVWGQRYDEPVRHHDGITQPDHQENRLDCIHLRLPGWDLSLDRDLLVLLRLAGLLKRQTPAFVHAIVPTIFVFFSIFAVNMVLHYKKVGPWKDYLFGERMYIVLSLLAKTVLAWQIWMGTLRP